METLVALSGFVDWAASYRHLFPKNHRGQAIEVAVRDQFVVLVLCSIAHAVVQPHGLDVSVPCRIKTPTLYRSFLPRLQHWLLQITTV